MIEGRKLHFWRDRVEHEMDFILEEAGKLVALEIKADSQITTSGAIGIRAFRDDLKLKASLLRGWYCIAAKHARLKKSFSRRLGDGLSPNED